MRYATTTTTHLIPVTIQASGTTGSWDRSRAIGRRLSSDGIPRRSADTVERSCSPPQDQTDLQRLRRIDHSGRTRHELERPQVCQRGASFAGPFSNVALGGRLFYKIETLYTHPMDDIIKQITKQLTDITYKLELLRTQYLEPATERIACIEQDVGAAAGSTQASLDRLTQTVQNIHP